MGKGRGWCTRLSGGRSANSGSASKVLEECCGELEPSEEEFDILVGLRFFSEKDMKIQKE